MSTLTLTKPVKKALGKLTLMSSYDNKQKPLIKFIMDYSTDSSLKQQLVNCIVSATFNRKAVSRYNNQRVNHPNIINHWTRYVDESWTTVFIISATSKHHAGVVASQFIDIDGYSFNSPYDCTGKPFTYEAEYIQLDFNKWAVTQRGSIDV